MIVALARPQTGHRRETVSSLGVDIVVALDISGSMACEDDPRVPRLKVAKRSIAEFVAGRPSDRIGLVAFASVATTRAPNTLDQEMLQSFVEQVEYAKSLGIDVIICDHHEPGGTIPDGVAVLDPIKPNCSYPFKHLCGCRRLYGDLASREGTPDAELWLLDTEVSSWFRAYVESTVFPTKGAAEQAIGGLRGAVDILRLALRIEKDSILFYHELLAHAPWPEARELLGKVIAEERRHLLFIREKLRSLGE